MQTNCPTFAAPTTMTIVYSGSITRNWSNGVSYVIATYTYTITNNTAFVGAGNNCSGKGKRVYHCSQANVSYDFREYVYEPSANTEFYYDPIADECSGCDDDLQCKTDITFCLSKTYRSYGTSRVMNKDAATQGVLEYKCCDACGCVRPSIQYRPASETLNTANDFFAYTAGCCTSTTSYEEAGVWILNQFEINGACGCPSASTWENVYSPPQGDGCLTVMPSPNYWPPNVVGTSWQGDFNSSCSAFDCNGIPNGVCFSGKASFNWFCYPEAGVELACSATLSFTDTCSQTMTVTLT
jgi:hypothetical protein